MDTILKKKLDDYLKENLKPARYEHTQRVVSEALKLAEKYGADAEKTEIAAFFHDACKNLSPEDEKKLVNKYGLNEKYNNDTNLIHGKLAASVLQDKFFINDEDILNAIRYHTTGRAGMSLLEKIIFAADTTEPGRKYDDASRLNELCYKNLDKACFEIFEWIIDDINKKGRYLDEDTIAARNWLKTEDLMSSNTIKEQAIMAAKTLDEKKGIDVIVLDISEKSSFADFFVIASGNTDRQVDALMDAVEDVFAKENLFVKSIEGKNGSGWILMDYSDFIVNIFTREQREKYNLEKIWGDCEYVSWEE